MPHDLPLVRTLMREYDVELGIDLSFQGFEEELRRLPGEYAPPRGVLLLARAGGEAVGVAAIRPFDGATCELKRMYLRPAWRGRGFGSELAEAAIDVARDAGYVQMRLDTLARLEPALKLYRSLGFVEIAAYRENPCDDVVYLELEL